MQVSLVRPVAVEHSKNKPLLLYLPGRPACATFLAPLLGTTRILTVKSMQELMAPAILLFHNCQGLWEQDLTSGTITIRAFLILPNTTPLMTIRQQH